MKNNEKKKWLILILTLIIVFTILIPLKFYTNYPYLISILGGILSGITIHKILFLNFKGEKPGCLYIITPIISIFLILLFVFAFNFRKEKNLISKGKITEGRIINKLSLESRKGEINDLTIEFIDSNNKTIEFTQEVSNNMLNSFDRNDKITIVYDSEKPIIAQTLHSNETVKKYTNIKNELLNFKNLISLSKEPKTIKLKIKNFGIWTNQTLFGNNGIWINIPNQETLISSEKYIIYKTKSTNIYILKKGIRDHKFKEVKNIESIEVKNIVNEILPIKGKNFLYQNEKQILILNEESKLKPYFTNSFSMPETYYTIKIINKTIKSL